jgi:diacylglycerol kinase
MRRIMQSFGHSIRGLVHALRIETNLRLFCIGHLVVLLAGTLLGIDIFSLLIATIFAGFFVAIELLNTALERLADTIDDHRKTEQGGHYHLGIKQAKDVGAAAALLALCTYATVLLLLGLPYLLARLLPLG